MQGHFVKTVAIRGKTEVNDSCLETFEFFKIVFKPDVRLYFFKFVKNALVWSALPIEKIETKKK